MNPAPVIYDRGFFITFVLPMITNLLFTLLLFQDISGGELILVLLAVFLLFGPNKIPEISRKIGAGIAKIKKATEDIQGEVNKTIEPIKKGIQDGMNEVKNTGQNQPANNENKPEQNPGSKTTRPAPKKQA